MWIKEVFKIGNVAMLECLESKKIEVDQDKTDRDTDRNTGNQLKNNIKTYDCQSISNAYMKMVCRYNKRTL